MNSKKINALRDSRKIVILSEAASARSAVAAKSKDPMFACAIHRLRKAFPFLLSTLLLLASLAHAQTLTGTAKNATTNKPAAGDEVILLKLGQGMEQAGDTKADAKGNFSFKLDDTQSPHLVRVVHQGVTYHRMAPPGTTSVEVQVYDVAKKIDGISNVADIMRMQADQGQLEVQRVFAVQNSSQPPRTEMNEHSLEFYVPDGAKIVEGSAMTAGGQPLTSAPVPEGEKNRYTFVFPLRPGETRFEVVYQLPYTGNANIDPKPVKPLEHLVVVLPKAMQFTAATGAPYQPLADPSQPGMVMQVASNAASTQPLSFRIAGEGVFPQTAENGGGQGPEQAQEPGQAGATQSAPRPGGGLGPPIDAPDPLQKYRWYILGGFAAVLIAGAVFVASRQQAAQRVARANPRRVREEIGDFIDDDETTPALTQVPVPKIPTAKSPTATVSRPALLEALKEELFDLEVERSQGRISEEEYAKAKSALDQTLERALRREAQKKA